MAARDHPPPGRPSPPPSPRLPSPGTTTPIPPTLPASLLPRSPSLCLLHPSHPSSPSAPGYHHHQHLKHAPTFPSLRRGCSALFALIYIRGRAGPRLAVITAEWRRSAGKVTSEHRQHPPPSHHRATTAPASTPLSSLGCLICYHIGGGPQSSPAARTPPVPRRTCRYRRRHYHLSVTAHESSG